MQEQIIDNCINKFLTNEYDVLTNINNKNTISESYAMLYDLLYNSKILKYDIIMNEIIDRYLYLHNLIMEKEIPYPYIITLNENNILIENKSSTQHFLWCSNMLYQHYIKTNNIIYYNKSKDIFYYIIKNNHINNILVNWINEFNYPIKNNNNIFSIKSLTNAKLFIIFEFTYFLNTQINFIKSNLLNKDLNIYESNYDLINNKIIYNSPSRLGDNLELAEGLLGAFEVSNNITYKNMAIDIIINCLHIVNTNNYVLGILQLYNFYLRYINYMPDNLKEKYEIIIKKYLFSNKLPSYLSNNNDDDNIFSYIYLARIFI